MEERKEALRVIERDRIMMDAMMEERFVTLTRGNILCSGFLTKHRVFLLVTVQRLLEALKSELQMKVE